MNKKNVVTGGAIILAAIGLMTAFIAQGGLKFLDSKGEPPSVPMSPTVTSTTPPSPVATKEFQLLITSSKTGKFLDEVEVQVIGSSIPETTSTDRNGYAKVKIPSEGDVSVNLSKQGYIKQRVTVNSTITQSIPRTFKLDPDTSLPTSTPPPTALPTSTSPPTALPTSTPKTVTESRITKGKNYTFTLNGCSRKGNNIDCDLTIKNIGEDRNQLELSARYSEIFTNKTRYIPSRVRLADQSSEYEVSLKMPSNIEIDASFSLNIPANVSKLELINFSTNDISPLKFTDIDVK